jgi:Fe-S-cluster containining protein
MGLLMDMMVGRTLFSSRDAERQVGPIIPCFRCGVCCREHHVRLSLVEARRIADGLGLCWMEFLEQYIEPRWPGSDSFLLRQHNGACIFFQDAGSNDRTSCLIHPFKPSACRDWTPSLYRRECQDGLAKRWGLRVGSLGELQGLDERIKEFQSFLSLMDGENSNTSL